MGTASLGKQPAQQQHPVASTRHKEATLSPKQPAPVKLPPKTKIHQKVREASAKVDVKSDDDDDDVFRNDKYRNKSAVR
jgi:hypothetical protein